VLSKIDNELLTRVGPGTPMGELLRQYWLPCLPSSELPEPDCAPKKVRLLGEDLVAFRNSDGEVGMIAEACPHRGASLFFGRNEEHGLRCVYHGWKFDIDGSCVDMPSEPAESNFKRKVHAKTYPCRDVNHMVWVYMGPSEVAPPFPPFEVNTLPEDHVLPPVIMMEQANWFQNLEGDIDSSHIDYLHSLLRFDSVVSHNIDGKFARDRTPTLEVVPTGYGAFYSGKRRFDEAGNIWHRITQLILPIHTMIAAARPETVTLRSHVPLDDHHSMLISQMGNTVRAVTEEEVSRTQAAFSDTGGYVPATSDPRTRYFTVANKDNDYLLDPEVQRTTQFTGISLAQANLQDRAMTELMASADGSEPIYDRSREHLGTTDAMVIMTRRMMIRAAIELRDQGIAPANVQNVELNRVRPASIVLPDGADWIGATEDARNYAAKVPIAYVSPT